MQERYRKNLGSFIQQNTQEILLTKKIAIIGCGGNGQYVAEFLARLGVQGLTIWDGDKFETSNLNRQPMSTEDLIGCLKTIATAQRLNKVNSEIQYMFYSHYFGDDSIDDLVRLMRHDLIVWCADNSQNTSIARQYLRRAIEEGIPVVDAGIHDKGGYISIITEQGLKDFDQQTKAWECGLINPPISQPAYLCAIIAGMTVSEIEKWFAQERNPAINQRIHYDINTNQIHRFDFTYGQLY